MGQRRRRSALCEPIPRSDAQAARQDRGGAGRRRGLRPSSQRRGHADGRRRDGDLRQTSDRPVGPDRRRTDRLASPGRTLESDAVRLRRRPGPKHGLSERGCGAGLHRNDARSLLRTDARGVRDDDHRHVLRRADAISCRRTLLDSFVQRRLRPRVRQQPDAALPRPVVRYRSRNGFGPERDVLAAGPSSTRRPIPSSSASGAGRTERWPPDIRTTRSARIRSARRPT